MRIRTKGKEGAADFEIAVAETVPWGDAVSGGHAFRIVLVTGGAAVVGSAGARTWIDAPAIACLNDRDGVEVEDSDSVAVSACAFHPSVVNEAFAGDAVHDPRHEGSARRDRFALEPFLRRDGEYSGFFCVGAPGADRAEELIRALAVELGGQEDGYWPCRSRAYLIELLFLVRRLYDSRALLGSVPAAAAGSMEKVALHIHAHYREPLTIAALASRFATNRTTLSARFKEYAGATVNDYIVATRIRVASALLRDTLLPVSEVMERTGFRDPTHFARCFRSRVGESPSEHRASHSGRAAIPSGTN